MRDPSRSGPRRQANERAQAQGKVGVGRRPDPIFAPARRPREDRWLMRALDLHNVKPVIDRSFPFKQLKEALQYLEKGEHFGKVVISF
ncbi:zinc-binding dehydrogenase [Rhodococcus sp. ACS1]|uniref:zinc-binding dehydrogenase n=1 Tax=Rhodococcus sp. ACS1 TaxID=2028570 RepID=UPI00359C6C39